MVMRFTDKTFDGSSKLPESNGFPLKAAELVMLSRNQTLFRKMFITALISANLADLYAPNRNGFFGRSRLADVSMGWP